MFKQNIIAFYQYANRCVVCNNTGLDMFKINQNRILKQNIYGCNHCGKYKEMKRFGRFNVKKAHFTE